MKMRILLFLISLCIITGCEKEEPQSEPEATSIVLLSGNNQFAPIAEMLTEPITVEVLDQNGNSYLGQKVTFTIYEGSISDTILYTDENGIASVTWTLGLNPGDQLMRITAFKDNNKTSLLGSLIKIKAEATAEIDNNYPTTINILSQDELSLRINEYYERNLYITTTLNDYGFCSASLRDEANLTSFNSVSIDEATAIVENFISINSNETGICTVNDVAYDDIDEFGENHWYFTTKNQTIDTIEVINTRIGFRVYNAEVVVCNNNWYPEIYVPGTFNFNPEKAKSILVNRVVTHLTWTGPLNITITSENLNESTVRLVIVPIEYEERIELKVTWEIDIPYPVHYLIYVDVMTGEIIREIPTIFS